MSWDAGQNVATIGLPTVEDSSAGSYSNSNLDTVVLGLDISTTINNLQRLAGDPLVPLKPLICNQENLSHP